MSSRHVFGHLKPRPGLCDGRHGTGTHSPDGWFSFPAAHWVPVPILPLQRDSRTLASPLLSLNPGLIRVSDFRAGYREPCGVLSGSQWLTEVVTHVGGWLSRSPPDPGGIAPAVVLGLIMASGRQQEHTVVFWGVDVCSPSTFDPRCLPHRALVPGKWLLGRCSQPKTL